jgi:hypothetical protein
MIISESLILAKLGAEVRYHYGRSSIQNALVAWTKRFLRVREPLFTYFLRLNLRYIPSEPLKLTAER